MQSLARVSNLGTSYTSDQVTALLLDSTNQERWLFDQLDAGLSFKADLTSFVDYEHTSPKISHDSSAAVKRNLQLTVRGDSPLDEAHFLSDIIRARYQLLAPDGGWIEWVLGHFTLTPFDQDIFPGWSWHTVRSPDFSQLLVDATFLDAYSVAVGTNYVVAITALASLYGGKTPINVNITPTFKTLPAVLSWETGIPYLQAINDLLEAINYFPAWFDEMGTLRSSPIPDYSVVNETFHFNTTQNQSIAMIPIRERPDISKVYNQIIVLTEDSRRQAIKASFVNDNPDDPISTINWHPKALVVRDSKLVDLDSAGARAKAEGQAASRIFGRKTISTLPWALSQDRDIYRLTYNTNDEGLQSFLYLESKWEMTCKAGAPTTHSLQRIIQ